MKDQYYVEGGVYVDATFTTVLKPERYGPFSTYDDAETVWSSRSRSQVDDCTHRLTIVRG